MKDEELINIAKLARKHSLSKATDYSVGAALIADSGTVYIGANIEDECIIGLSNCAERVAIQNAMSHGERKILKIAIVGGKNGSKTLDDTLTPCGVCLQYMLDFCEDVDILVYINGKLEKKKIKELINNPFKLSEKL